MKWQSKLGFFVTALWLGLGVLYIWQVAGFDRFMDPTIGVIGDFFAGLFAPLAFLWLVIGYFQQGEELRLQRTELELQRQQLSVQSKETRRLADEAGRQAVAVEANELHARRDTFLRFAVLTSDELHKLAVKLVKILVKRVIVDVWNIYNKGEKDAFYGQIVSHFSGVERMRSIERLKQVGEWPKTVELFCSKVEYLLVQATACDSEGQLLHHFESTTMGKAGSVLREALDEDSEQ